MSQEANLIIRLKDTASKGLKSLRNSINKLNSAAKKTAAVGLAALTGALGISIRAATVQENSINELNEALKNNGDFTLEASKSMQEYAASLQKVTTFGDEQIIQAQALLARFTKLKDEGLKDATKATLDIAAALNVDLNTAAQLVGKTLGSTTNALARYGVSVTGAAGSQERLNSLVQNAGVIFGGAAEAKAKTLAGSIQQLKNRFGDLTEEVGFQLFPILKNDVIPAIDSLLSAIEGGAITSFASKIKQIIIVFQLWFVEIKRIKDFLTKSLFDTNQLDIYKKKFIGLFKDNKKQVMELELEQKKAQLAESERNSKLLNERRKLIEELTKVNNKYQEEQNAAIETNTEKQNEARKQEEEQREEDAEKKQEDLEKQAEFLAAQEELKKQAEEERLASTAKALSAEQSLAAQAGQALVQGEQAASDLIGEEIKKRLNASIDAFAATEIGKALAQAPATFGGSLSFIPIIQAAASGAKAIVNAQQFHAGGVIGRDGTSRAPSQGLRSNERQITAQVGERVLTQQTDAQLMDTLSKINQTISRGGNNNQMISINVDGRQIARASAKYQSSFQKLNRAGSL